MRSRTLRLFSNNDSFSFLVFSFFLSFFYFFLSFFFFFTEEVILIWGIYHWMSGFKSQQSNSLIGHEEESCKANERSDPFISAFCIWTAGTTHFIHQLRLQIHRPSAGYRCALGREKALHFPNSEMHQTWTNHSRNVSLVERVFDEDDQWLVFVVPRRGGHGRFYSHSGMRVAREWTTVSLIPTIPIPE